MGLTNEEIRGKSKEDQQKLRLEALEMIDDLKREQSDPKRKLRMSAKHMEKIASFIQEEIAEQERIVRAVDEAQAATPCRASFVGQLCCWLAWRE